MINKFIILFKIARKIALSDALKVISKVHKTPIIIKIIFNIFSFSLKKNNEKKMNSTHEERLCESIEAMATTFIKMGQI